MEDNVKKELDQLGNLIDSKIEKASNQAIERADKKADETLKREIENLTAKFNERMDAVEMSQKKLADKSNNRPLSFSGALSKSLNEGALDNFRNGNSNAVTLNLKSANMLTKADMTISADFSSDVIAPQRVEDFKYDPAREFHMRSILPVGNTDSDVVRYISESAYSDGSAVKNEGVAYSQSDFNMTATSVNIEKMGTYFRISEEMMSSTPQLQAYLSNRAPQKLLAVEDAQILDGTGSAPQYNGIFTQATSFSAGGFANAISNANEFDCIVVALNQLALANYKADYILMNPSDFHKILLLKSSQAEYLIKDFQQGLVPRINGVPVIPSTAITSDKYLVGNFAQGCQYWIKDNVSLGFFREDGTNVRDGFVTVRCQLRGAVAVYLPNAFVKGDFSTDKTALASS